jgi:HK97 family phage major capsid protein
MKKVNKILYGLLIALVILTVTTSPLLACIVFGLSLIASTYVKTFGVLTMGMTSQEEELVMEIEKRTKKQVHELQTGMITLEVFNKRMEKIDSDLSTTSSLYAEDLKTKITELRSTLEDKIKLIDAELVKYAKMVEQRNQGIEDNLRDILSSDDFKKFAESPSGRTKEMKLRFSLTSNYTGTALLTKKVADPILQPERKAHIRDLVPIVPTDMPVLVAPKVTAFVDNGNVVAENGTVTASTMTIAEETWTLKRLTAFVDAISYRALKSIKWLENYIRLMLTSRLLFVEDGQMLLGDNASNNLDGMLKNFSVMTFTGPAILAHAVESVATWNTTARTIVKTHLPHGIPNGYKITISNATNGPYNATFDCDVLDAYRFVINSPYVAEAAPQIDAWTAVTYHPYKDSVDNANELDCLKAAIAMCQVGEFQATGGIIHPSVGTKITAFLKNAVEFDYLQLNSVVRRGGFLWIDNVPFVESTACPIGRFFIGDFSAVNIQLCPFTDLTITFAADVANIKANTVVAIIQEEVIFPIFNPYVLWSADFTTFKAELET